MHDRHLHGVPREDLSSFLSLHFRHTPCNRLSLSAEQSVARIFAGGTLVFTLMTYVDTTSEMRHSPRCEPATGTPVP